MHTWSVCIFYIFVFCHYVSVQAGAIGNSDKSVSGAALDTELKVVVESMHDSSLAEESSVAVSEQQPPMTNDRDPSDLSGSIPLHGTADSDSDELAYEILPIRCSRREVLSSDYSEPMYEISSALVSSGASTPQVVPNYTSSVRPEADDDCDDVPQVPARPNMNPGVPSPIGSPAPAPRKTSKGHIDVSKLTQVVLPPSPVPNFSLGSSPTPPVTIPRVPPRLGTSQSVSTPSTPVPGVLPRKRSEGQTIRQTKNRRLPPPPMPPPVPEASVYHVLSTDDPTVPRTGGSPVLPQRCVRHQNSASADRFATSRSAAKRPSVGALKGYEDKCVEVDSGNPSKFTSRSSRYVENRVLCLFNNMQNGIAFSLICLTMWRMESHLFI